MIFWPYKPIVVMGVRLPMTPGLFVARRREFASAFAQALVDRFLGPRDVVQSLGQALDAGLENKILEALPPAIAKFAKAKVDDLSVADIRALGEGVSKFIRESGMVDKLIVGNIEAMPAVEMERMVKNVCGRELRTMAFFDAGVGGTVGLVHGLVAYLLS